MMDDMDDIEDTETEITFEFFSDEEDIEYKNEFASLESGEERVLKVRLDKWLWAARFFKTRAVARAAVEKGRVFYNGERSKPSREIEIGALLQIRHGRFEKTVMVKGLSTRRRSTDEALQLFEVTEEHEGCDNREGRDNRDGREVRDSRLENSDRQPDFNIEQPLNCHNRYTPYNPYNPNRNRQDSVFTIPQGSLDQPRERRPIRFLRRSFGRDQQPQYSERPQDRGSDHYRDGNKIPQRPPEYETSD